MRKEIIPGVDRNLTVAEISEWFGPEFRKDQERLCEFFKNGGKLDDWAAYERENWERWHNEH